MILSLSSIAQTKNIVYNKYGDSIIISIDSLEKLNYNGKNYFHYLQEYSKAERALKSSLIIILAGTSTLGVGLGFLYLSRHTTFPHNALAPIFISSGIIITSVGIISWGSNISKSIKNEDMMNKCQQNSLSLKLGLNQDGIGLILTF